MTKVDERLARIREQAARFTALSRQIVALGLDGQKAPPELDDEADELIHDLACDVGWLLARLDSPTPKYVYVVEQGCYSDKGICGVYASPEDAMAAHPVPDSTHNRTREGGWQPSVLV